MTTSVRHTNLYLLLVVKAVVSVLCWTGVEVLYDVIGLGFKQMVITVFDQEVFNFLAAYKTFVFAVNSAEGCIGLECYILRKRLPLPFNGCFFFCNHDHQTG